MQPRWLIIAEATTFPALGRALYNLGPGRTITALAKAFARLHDHGLSTCTTQAEPVNDIGWAIAE